MLARSGSSLSVSWSAARAEDKAPALFLSSRVIVPAPQAPPSEARKCRFIGKEILFTQMDQRHATLRLGGERGGVQPE